MNKFIAPLYDAPCRFTRNHRRERPWPDKPLKIAAAAFESKLCPMLYFTEERIITKFHSSVAAERVENAILPLNCSNVFWFYNHRFYWNFLQIYLTSSTIKKKEQSRPVQTNKKNIIYPLKSSQPYSILLSRTGWNK